MISDNSDRVSCWAKLSYGMSLRLLMVVVLVLGGGMGWLAYRACVQREAVAAIRATRSISLFVTEITDAGLVHLASLSECESLRLDKTQVTNAAIALLQTQLPTTSIWGPPFPSVPLQAAVPQPPAKI